MKNSFLEGYNSVNVHSGTPQPEYSGLFDKVYVDVRPLETTAVDSLTNRFADKSVPYQVKRIGTVIVPTVWSSIVNFFAMFAIIALSNVVNFTDGLDGLLSSVTLVLSIGYLIFCYLLGMGEMGIMAGALGGGCIGFLFWNHYPAKVFMGDTGSLFMSGMVIALAFGTGLPFFVVLFGIIYVIEIGSVVLQRCYFKLTHGKRIFKMSPIHHHFEMSGYSEKQIVVMFAVITAIGSALGILAFRFI